MPVSQVAVTSEPLDADSLVALVDAEGDGAVVTFAGLVRNHNQGRRIQFLEYEAYEPLAVRALQRIVDEARDLWPGARAVHTAELERSHGWYDLSVATDEDHAFLRRLAGHVETGRPSSSDPAIATT